MILPMFLGLGILMVVFSGLARGQGIERESLAGESAEETVRNTNLANQPYNLQVGPVNLRVDADAAVSYNDNINIAKTGRENDIIFTPSLNVHGFWQATDLNSLTLDIGLGYQTYLTHSNFDSILVSPGSEAQFNIFVGDFKINLHDLMSFQDNPIQVAELSNTTQFPLLTNDAGLEVDWDLGDMVASLGYDHTNDWVFNNTYDYLNDQSDILSPALTFKLTKTVQVGLNSWLTDQRYDQHVENDSDGVRGGPFVRAQLTENLSLQAQAGYDYTNYDKGGSIGDNENLSSYYWSGGVSHRINDVLNESLTFGREFISGLTSNFTRRYYANYAPAWQAMTNLTIAPTLWWENLQDSDAIIRQKANRYGFGLDMNYQVTEHSSIYLGYQYVLKTADPSSLNYYQNVATLGFRYQF
jgi:hypothetical protein